MARQESEFEQKRREQMDKEKSTCKSFLQDTAETVIGLCAIVGTCYLFFTGVDHM